MGCFSGGSLVKWSSQKMRRRHSSTRRWRKCDAKMKLCKGGMRYVFYEMSIESLRKLVKHALIG